MANNRMYLKCTTCGERFYLAKYYPNTAWYWPALLHGLDPLDAEGTRLLACESYTHKLDNFFEEHQHVKDMYGENFSLEYE